MSAVVVVGAGIVGSSVAYHLARRGVPVTLLDQGPAPATGVTGNSFAWIGGSGGHWPGGARDLREYVLADYRRLEDELPQVTVRRTGSLSWADVPAADSRLEPGQFRVGRSEIAALEPNLRHPPDQAVHTPSDAGVDPTALSRTLVAAAGAHGATVLHNAPVTSLRVTDGRRRSPDIDRTPPRRHHRPHGRNHRPPPVRAPAGRPGHGRLPSHPRAGRSAPGPGQDHRGER